MGRHADLACVLREGRRNVNIRASAADLKFLHRLRQTHSRNFKSKSGTRIICLLVPFLLPKFVSEGAAMYHELRKRGTTGFEYFGLVDSPAAAADRRRDGHRDAGDAQLYQAADYPHAQRPALRASRFRGGGGPPPPRPSRLFCPRCPRTLPACTSRLGT